MTKIFLCKAIIGKETTTVTGPDWVTSKRTILKITAHKFIFAGLEIPFTDIVSASLKKVPSAFLVPGAIFSIKTSSGETHHLGLRFSNFFKNGLPFPVHYEELEVKGIFIRRLLILSLLIYMIWSLTK